MQDAAPTFLADRRSAKDRSLPLLVAIDGGGGAGKSTLAAALARALDGIGLVHVDDFYRPMDEEVRRRLTPEAAYALLFDWERLETEVVIPLAARRAARYHRYDWETGVVLPGMVELVPAGIVVVEGVYTLRPELRDHWDVAIYVDTPKAVRLVRLKTRSENTPSQIKRWESAEAFYRAAVHPVAQADLVIRGG